MPFYTDIAKPARDRALKQLQPQTEEEMDPMGYTTTPRMPIASGPDIPTAQPLPLAPSDYNLGPSTSPVRPALPLAPSAGLSPELEKFGLQDIYATALETEAASRPQQPMTEAEMDRYGSTIREPAPVYDPRGRQKGMETAAQEAAVGGFRGQTVDLTPKMMTDSLLDALAERGVKVNPVPTFPSEGGGMRALMALGVAADVGGALFEFAAETGWESVKFALGTGDVPTVFKEGFVATVEQHRKRHIAAQIGLGIVFDPFILAKVFTIPAKASGTVLRSTVKSQLVELADNNAVVLSRTQIDEAVEDIAIQYENPQQFQNPLGNFDDVDLSFDDLPPVGAAREAPGAAYRTGAGAGDPEDAYQSYVDDLMARERGEEVDITGSFDDAPAPFLEAGDDVAGLSDDPVIRAQENLEIAEFELQTLRESPGAGKAPPFGSRERTEWDAARMQRSQEGQPIQNKAAAIRDAKVKIDRAKRRLDQAMRDAGPDVSPEMAPGAVVQPEMFGAPQQVGFEMGGAGRMPEQLIPEEGVISQGRQAAEARAGQMPIPEEALDVPVAGVPEEGFAVRYGITDPEDVATIVRIGRDPLRVMEDGANQLEQIRLRDLELDEQIVIARGEGKSLSSLVEAKNDLIKEQAAIVQKMWADVEELGVTVRGRSAEAGDVNTLFGKVRKNIQEAAEDADQAAARELQAGQELTPAAAPSPAAVPTPVAAADEVAAPRFVETSKPRYKNSKIDFDSPLDKALYIVADSARRSKRDPEILRFAMDATGLSEAGARSAGDNIRSAIKGIHEEGSDIRLSRQYDAPRIEAAAPEPAAVVPIPSPAQVAGPSSPSRLEISQTLSKNDVVITESRGGWNARVERRKTNDIASYSLVSGAESEEVAKRQAYDALQARHAGDGGGPRRPIEEALDDAVDPDDAGELYPEIGRMLEKGEYIRDMDRPAMVGKLIDSLPGIGEVVDWARPANTLSEDIILAHVTKTSTRAMLNSKATFWRQLQLYPVLQKTFGPNALSGNPIDQIVFIGSLDQVVPFNKTLFDIAQRPSLYQLDEAQKNALAIWSRHQDQLTEEVVEGYGVKLRNFETPEGAVFLSSVDVNDDLLKQLDSTEYKQVQKGRGQARVHDSAADRWLSDLNKAVNDKSAQLKRDLTPKEIDELKGDVKFKPLVDIEKLQAGMDVWKNNNAARQVFKEGSGGKTRAEALELILNPITGKPKYQGLIDARKVTIRQIANLRNRIEKYRVPTGAIDPETGKPIYTQQPSAKGGLKDKQNFEKAETKARQIARRINEIQTQIDDAGDAARAGGDVGAANGDIYGPQFSYLHGQLHELNVSLTKSFKDASTYQEFVGDKAAEGVAMMEELEGLLHKLYGNPAGTNRGERIGLKGRYDAIGPESDGWTLVTDGGLYRYYKGDDARNIQKLVKMDENGVLAAVEEIRSTAFAADLSPLFGVQLPLAAIANPKGVASSLIGAGKESVKYRDIKRIFRTQNMVKVISEDFDGYMDYAFYTGREVIAATPQEFKGGLLAKLPLGMGKKFTQANEAMYSVVLRQSKNLYDEGIKDLLKAGASPEQAKAISADAANKVIPMWNPSRLGMSVQKEQLFRTLPTSISFLTKPVELMATATSGYLKLPLVATGKATLSFQERLAIKWTTRMAAAWMTAATTSQVAATFYSDTDKDPWQAAKDAIIPGSGSWGAIQIGPYKIPAGGPFRGFIQALVPRDVAGVPFPVPFAGLWNWANNRVTPVISNTIDQYKNEDFYGAKIVPKDASVGEEIFRRFAYAIEGGSPLTVGSVVGNVRRGLGNVEDFGNLIDWQKVAEDFLSQLGGSNMSKESPYTTSDLAARKWAKDNGITKYSRDGDGDEIKRTRDLSEGQLKKFREERPDLKERIDEEVEKAASLEIEWAVNTYRAMELKAEAGKNQQLADDKMADFWLDAAIPGAMNPSEWREERRNRMLTLAAGRREIYGDDFPEKDEKDKTPTDRYYEEFDRIRTTVGRGQMTEDAWDEMERWIASQTPKDRGWIETNTGLSNLTPKVKEYHEDMAKLGEYWQIEEEFFKEFPLAEETKFLWDQYKNATKAEKQTGMYSDLREIEEGISEMRQEYRWENKEVDSILAKWDYSGVPVHEENYDLWVKLPVLPDFHFRESEAEPKMTPPPSQVQPQGTTPDSSEDLFAGMLAETGEAIQSSQPEQTEDLFEGLLAGAR